MTVELEGKSINKKRNRLVVGLMGVGALTAGVVVGLPVAEAATPNAESDFTTKAVTGGVEIVAYKGTSKIVVIPTTIGGVAVTSIGDKAFYNLQLLSLVLPGSLTNIGSQAFLGNALVSVDFPTGVTNIGDHAFAHNKLTSLVLPGGITKVGNNTFADNTIASVVIPKGVTSIGANAFARNQLASVTLPEGLTEIWVEAFATNKLTSVKIPSTVLKIENYAFGNNKINSITMEYHSTTIAGTAFDANTTPTSAITMYGGDPSTAKTYALAKGYTFIIKEPDPVVPDPDPDPDPDPVPGSDSGSQTANFSLIDGGLTLTVPSILSFGNINIGKVTETHYTAFDDVFTVTDARGSGDGWRLDVSATQFTVVEPVGGFESGTSAITLPAGTLGLSPLDNIDRKNVGTGNLPVGNLVSETTIDTGGVTVATANAGDGMGTYELTYPTGALSLTINPSTAKTDTVNYPGGLTPYESTVTWDLVSAP